MRATGGIRGVILSTFGIFGALASLSCAGGSGVASLASPDDSTAPDSSGSGGIISALGGNFTVGSRVGEFELSVPAGDSAQGNSFLLHGMLPVPQGAFPPGSPANWLAVADFDGTMIPAQLERATRYGNGDTATFEVIARVRRDPSKTAGTRVVYPVHLISDSTGASYPSNGPASNVPGEIADLASGARKILIVATDVFGNQYLSAPLGMQHKRVFRDGPFEITERSYSILHPYPVVAGAQGTLPELLGVHSFMTQMSSEKVLGLDLRIHNGLVGPDPNHQNPIRPVYVKSIQICVPVGYTVLNSLKDPYWNPNGKPFPWNGQNYTAFDLVKPMANGAMHVINKQAQTNRRLAVTVVGNEPRAQAILDMEGIAFNRHGVDAASGQDLWSWWNPQTSNFMAGNTLPNMNFWGAQNLRSLLANQFHADKQTFEAGNVTTIYPWCNPGGPFGGQSGGVQYGGMTGGTDVYMNNGVEAAFAGSREAIRHAALLSQAYANRQPNLLINPDGSSVSAPQIAKTMGNGTPCALFKFFQQPEGSFGLNYFQLNEPPTFQEAYVASHNLKPGYEADHFAFMSQDYQHQIRYSRHLFTLSFLANDPMAKEDLEFCANNGRMAEPDLPICSSGSAMGLLGANNFANSHPGTANGFFGRGQGWLTYANTLYYAMADDAWRAQTKPWLDRIVTTAQRSQVPCTGVLYCNVSNKGINSNERMRQHFEQMIWNNTMQSMVHNVYEGTGSPLDPMLRTVLKESAYSFIRPVAWSPGQGPWKFLGVSDLNPSTAPNFCSLPLPPNSAGQIDNYMIYDTFAYGFRLSGDATFIAKAIEISGGSMGGLKNKLETTGYNNNIENNAVLLQLMQSLGWVTP